MGEAKACDRWLGIARYADLGTMLTFCSVLLYCASFALPAYTIKFKGEAKIYDGRSAFIAALLTPLIEGMGYLPLFVWAANPLYGIGLVLAFYKHHCLAAAFGLLALATGTTMLFVYAPLIGYYIWLSSFLWLVL